MFWLDGLKNFIRAIQNQLEQSAEALPISTEALFWTGQLDCVVVTQFPLLGGNVNVRR